MVAAHHGDGGARSDAGGRQAVSDRVGAVLHLLEGQLPELVDDRGLAGEERGAESEPGSRCGAPAGDQEAGLEQPVGGRRLQEAGRAEDGQVLQLLGRGRRQRALGGRRRRLRFDEVAERLQGSARRGADQGCGEPFGQQAGQVVDAAGAGDGVDQTQRHLGGPVAAVPDPPAAAVLDAPDRRPGELPALVLLDHLDLTAEVGGADPEADVVAGADAFAAVAALLPVSDVGHEAGVARGILEQPPDPLAAGPDLDRLLDPHAGLSRPGAGAVPPPAGPARAAWRG